MDMSTVITLGGVQITMLGERVWLVIIIIYMMVVVAPAAQARARPGTSKGDLEQERLFFPDKLPVLNKEDWSLCMDHCSFS
jgi:hypothetical protein